MDLFGRVSGEDLRIAQIVTGATLAAFIGVGLVPGLRGHVYTIRLGLLGLYLVVCAALVIRALVR